MKAKKMKNRLTIQQVAEIVSDTFQIDIVEFISKTRKYRMPEKRFIHFYFCKKLGYTLTEIGRFWRCGHPNVFQGIKKIKDLYDIDKDIRYYMDLIETKIKKDGAE